VFSGLLWDGNCGLPMHWRHRDGSRQALLATATKHIDGAKPNTVDYVEFESVFLSFLDQLDWAEVIDAHDSKEIRNLEDTVRDLELATARVERRIATIVEELVKILPSPALRSALRVEESALQGFKEARSVAMKQLEMAKARHRDLLSPNVVYTTLAQTRDLETRIKLKAEIRARVSSIVFWFSREPATPRLVEDSAKDLFPFCEITFTNSQKRYVLLQREVIVTLATARSC
jgi:hypothetical protein